MTVHKIDKMIATVRKDHLSQKQARQQKLEDRRNTALTRIGQAVIAHELPLGQSTDLEYRLKARLRQAQRARISEAEAMADLAEFNGDLDSPLHWWELKNKKESVLWKGYVVDERLARIRFTVEFEDGVDRLLDINVRRACKGEIVASLYVEGNGVESVGASSGKKASVREAVVNAYEGFVNEHVDELFDSEIPGELLEGIDSDSGYGITNLRSLENAQNSQRELDGGNQNGNDV